MSTYTRSVLLALVAYNSATAHCHAIPSCSSFAQSADLSDLNATVLDSTYYPVGAREVAGTVNKASFCEIHASISYGTNSSLVFAIWLPDEQYSSRFMAIGNGGQAGVIEYPDMMTELNSGLGFAIAGGDAGHRASDNDAGAGPGLGAPGVYQPYLNDEDQVRAWIRDGISIMTPVAKALVNAFYGEEADKAYFRGCSAGGAQGFALAESHPDLFDGIIAGGPINLFTNNMLAFLWNDQHTPTDDALLPQSLLDFIQASVIKECDLIDGVEDKVIANPLACPFDISSLACGADNALVNSTCLTPTQIAAARAIYQGPVRSDSPQTSVFPGVSLGSEAGWMLPSVLGALSDAFTVPILQNLVYQDLNYDPATFNWGSDVDFVNERAGPLINAIKTDLSAFRDRGGKMIVYAGWADPNIAPMWALQHVEAITQDTLGKEVTIAENDFIKLVMVPGGGHCGANIARYPYVPAQYDFPTAMVDWVEKEEVPSENIRSWGPTNGEDRTRKLCTWPQIAKLQEGGDIDDWESYVCE